MFCNKNKNNSSCTHSYAAWSRSYNRSVQKRWMLLLSLELATCCVILKLQLRMQKVVAVYKLKIPIQGGHFKVGKDLELIK